MKKILSFIISIASFLNAEIVFHSPASFEKDEIRKSMITFYADQLMQAGLYDNKAKALEVAEDEIDQEPLDKQHFFMISSKEIQYGYLVYTFEDKAAYLDAIYLKEAYQGKGYGKQALHHLEKLLLVAGTEVLKLYVFDHNKRAMNLYNNLGYEIDTTYYLNDKPIGYHMKKHLNESSVN